MAAGLAADEEALRRVLTAALTDLPRPSSPWGAASLLVLLSALFLVAAVIAAAGAVWHQRDAERQRLAAAALLGGAGGPQSKDDRESLAHLLRDALPAWWVPGRAQRSTRCSCKRTWRRASLGTAPHPLFPPVCPAPPFVAQRQPLRLPPTARRVLSPDSSSCSWLNGVLGQVWPRVERFAGKFLMADGLLEGMVNATTFWRPTVLRSSYFNVQHVSLGQVRQRRWCRGAQARTAQLPGRVATAVCSGPPTTYPSTHPPCAFCSAPRLPCRTRPTSPASSPSSSLACRTRRAVGAPGRPLGRRLACTLPTAALAPLPTCPPNPPQPLAARYHAPHIHTANTHVRGSQQKAQHSFPCDSHHGGPAAKALHSRRSPCAHVPVGSVDWPARPAAHSPTRSPIECVSACLPACRSWWSPALHGTLKWRSS